MNIVASVRKYEDKVVLYRHSDDFSSRFVASKIFDDFGGEKIGMLDSGRFVPDEGQAFRFELWIMDETLYEGFEDMVSVYSDRKISIPFVTWFYLNRR